MEVTHPKSTKTQNKARRLLGRRALSFVGNMRHNLTARFGIAFKNKRTSLGLTQQEISKVTGLSRSYISEIECGKESISLERAEKLAQAVSSSLSDLLREN
jgi:DNA-binding XRE family transcriptional regulator